VQQIKTEDDFSVILADVRKTCYSSWLVSVVTIMVWLWKGSLRTLKETTLSYSQPSPTPSISGIKVHATPHFESANPFLFTKAVVSS
jgi:hypothetical protein